MQCKAGVAVQCNAMQRCQCSAMQLKAELSVQCKAVQSTGAVSTVQRGGCQCSAMQHRVAVSAGQGRVLSPHHTTLLGAISSTQQGAGRCHQGCAQGGLQSTEQWRGSLCCIVLHCIALCCSMLHCIAVHCLVVCCIVLHYIARSAYMLLHQIALYHIV